MLPDEAQRARYLAGAESVVLEERDLRGKPELGFAAGPLDVDMQAGFLAGEEVEAQATRPKDRRTPARMLHRQADLRTSCSGNPRAAAGAAPQSPKLMPRSRAVSTVSLSSGTVFMRFTASLSGS